MAAIICPNYNDPTWKELATKLGEDTLPESQQTKSMKMFIDAGNSIDSALAQFKKSSRKKEEALKAVSDRVVFINTPDPITGKPRHEYEDRSGEKLTSVSRKLDEIPALRYRGDDAVGQLYSDSGTTVHSIFEQYASGVSNVNLLKFASDHGVPESVVHYASAFIEGLRHTGTVLVEVNLRDPNHPIAGRADIIHLKDDGTVDLYDIKTAYRTPHKIVGNAKIWNPVQDYDGYKAQRYSTQLEYYAQMIEKAIGHPVSGQYILPIEIEFQDDTPTNPMSTVHPVGVENTLAYGYQRRARQFVDASLGVKRITPLPGLPEVDDSSDLVTRLTGTIQNLRPNLDAQAEEMLIPSRGFTKQKGGFLMYRKGNSWHTFRNQKDHQAQKQELIDRVLSGQELSFRDIAPSMQNYIQTGKDAFLEGKGQSLSNLRAVLEPYRNMDYEVLPLSDIQGFEGKKGWTLIKKGDKTDLLYVGSEELTRPFMVARERSLFGANRSLFGNAGFSWKDAKYELGSALQNTVGDARKLESALIAMKLKTIMPNLSLDRILVHSISQSSSIPHAAVLEEILPVVKNLFNHPKAKELLPTTYRSLVSNKDLFDPATYKQDYAKSYHDLLGDALTYGDKLALDAVENYNAGKLARDEVEASILQRISDLTELGDSDPKTLDQRRLLSEMLYFLRQVPSHIQPVGKYFEKWASMSQNVANQVIQDVVIEFRNSLARVRTRFWEGYKKDFNSTLASLFAASGSTIGRLADYTISNTTRYYEPLFQRQSFKTQKLDARGNPTEETVALPNFSLVPEGSTEFETLSPEQQNAIRKINDTIEQGAKIMGIEWVRGRVPLMRSTFYNKFYRTLKGDEHGYAGLLERAFSSIEESFSTGLDGDNATKPRSLQNRFEYQANTDFSDGKRMELLGITEDGHVDLSKHGEWETNLEVVADMFMMEAIRVQEFNKVNKLFMAAQNLFEWQKSRLFDERMGVNLDFVKVWRDAMIHMRDQDSGTTISKGVNAINKLVSISTITKPSVGAFAYLSQQLSVFSQAVSNSIGKSTDFGVGDWNRAFSLMMNPKNKEKVDLLLEQYGIFDLSMADLTNGRRREGNKSIFRLKYLYFMLSAGDWMSRGQITVAQMLKNGSWDAYSVKDHKLVYDEKQDGRFNGTTLDQAKGKALKDFTARELQEQGIQLNADGTLPRAYGASEGNYIKNLSDATIGGFDRESRALYSFFAFGKLIGLFKSWLPARLNAMFDSKFQSRINGAIEFEQKADGSYTAVWKGREMEGILNTLGYLGWYVAKYRQNPYQKMTRHQQNNLRLAAAHTIVLATAALAALALEGDDDDKDPWKQYAATTLQRSLGDIVATYNVLALKDFLYTPIAIVFIDKTLRQTWNILSGNQDINSNALHQLVQKVPLANWSQIYTLVDGEEDNKNP